MQPGNHCVSKDEASPSRCRGSNEKKQNSMGLFGHADVIRFACLAVLLLLAVIFLSGEDEWHYERKQTEVAGSTNSISNLLDGLLPGDFHESSCMSRYRSALYRTPSPYKPSEYLLQRLRKYEDLHRKCAPNTDLYNKSISILESQETMKQPPECRYIVWLPDGGLGNKMIAIVSAFLYALLTDRVLLLNRGFDVGELFCEPFPGGSWLLPSDSPLARFHSQFHVGSPATLGNALRDKESGRDNKKYVYVYLKHDFNQFDELYFCSEGQELLRDVPWLVLLANQYFVPMFFRMPEYEAELSRLFPETVTVFHHLGRYLFHPSNDVWGLIMRSYMPYLARADKRIGLQVRVFQKGAAFASGGTNTTQALPQLMQCLKRESLLPEASIEYSSTPLPSPKPNSTAVLITSLSAVFAEHMKNLYWERPTANGEMISVYQPSHEEKEMFDKISMMDMKALAEVYLLSMTDVMVTSAYSTFGYIAQGIRGTAPWMLSRAERSGAVPEPPCRKVASIEPCYHAPPSVNCKTKSRIDMAVGVSYIRHCEDVSFGLKLFDRGV